MLKWELNVNNAHSKLFRKIKSNVLRGKNCIQQVPQGHMKLVLMRFLTVMLFVYKTPLNNVFLSLIRIHFMSFRGPEDQTEFIPTGKVHNTQACGVS